jgi:NADPH-dependent F420 reductase
MKIAVIGIGNVGGTLGTRWAIMNHEVVFGVREPTSPKVKSLLKLADNKAQAASVPDAVAASDVVVLATPWEAVADAIAVAGDLKGKVIVDCTNPVAERMSGLSIGQTTSAGERVAEWTKGARVIKAFNSTGANNMANPVYGEHKATMFICGDDPEAKAIVSNLAGDLGFDVCDSGPLRVARYLEPLAMLWIHLAYAQGLGREFAFTLLKR